MRLFFAIDFPTAYKIELQKGLAALRVQVETLKEWQPLAPSWTLPQNLHITLQFLGEVEAQVLGKLISETVEELREAPSITLELGRPGWFSSDKDPRILSLSVEPQQSLRALSQALGKVIVCLGLPLEDRPYRGHLTLAKVKAKVAKALDLADLKWPPLKPLRVEEVMLYQSQPSKRGSLYTQMGKFKLNGL
jgi:2'-5' RNA ligase